MLIRIDANTIFTAKVIKSRNSFTIWIPQNEAKLLKLKPNELIKVGLERIKHKSEGTK